MPLIGQEATNQWIGQLHATSDNEAQTFLCPAADNSIQTERLFYTQMTSRTFRLPPTLRWCLTIETKSRVEKSNGAQPVLLEKRLI